MTLRAKRNGKTAVIAIIVMLLWGIATLWSWNTFAVDLLGLPEMAFRHALALCLLILSVGAVFVPPLCFSQQGIKKCP